MDFNFEQQLIYKFKTKQQSVWKRKIKNLYNKDNNSAYETLLELEELSVDSNELYPYFDAFLSMLKSEKTFMRVRGFRLICSLAK